MRVQSSAAFTGQLVHVQRSPRLCSVPNAMGFALTVGQHDGGASVAVAHPEGRGFVEASVWRKGSLAPWSCTTLVLPWRQASKLELSMTPWLRLKKMQATITALTCMPRFSIQVRISLGRY